MSAPKEKTPPEVPASPAKQGGEAPLELRMRLGAEPEAWTERMLAALESGVKGGRWFSLHDKTSLPRVLRAAWERVLSRGGSGGIDGQRLAQFAAHEDAELERLSRELEAGTYRPRPVRRVWIPKPGSRERRPLGVPTVRDRVAQTALLMTVGPIFEIGFSERSYGFRPARGAKDALRRVDSLLKSGHVHVVDADLKSYFDTVDHGMLMELVEGKVADGDTLELLRRFLKAGVMETAQGWSPTESGTPQGAVVSPLLSNLYLDGLDRLMEERGFEMVRYADDFVVLCRSREKAEEALVAIRRWCGERRLTLHPEKTRVVREDDPGGFEFLGYRFERGKRFPRSKSLGKLRDAVRARTRRNSGESMREIVESLNPTLRGWFEYFKHSYRTTYPSIDGWIRMRLRSIYRKRRGRRGRGRGNDHQRYPNRHFAEIGLFSLERAYREACQSRR